jgi:SPP1 family predicted phage head-tail adaptor
VLDAGKLKNRITFEKPSTYIDGDKGQSVVWTYVGECWASIEPLTARELLNVMQVQASITHRIRCRFLSGINASMRIRYQERMFAITSVIDKEENHVELEILAEEQIKP